MPRVEGRQDRLDRGGQWLRIAEHPVIEVRLQGGDHLGRCAEVHVGNPKREHIPAGVFEPFLRVGSPSVDHRVKIVGHAEREGA